MTLPAGSIVDGLTINVTNHGFLSIGNDSPRADASWNRASADIRITVFEVPNLEVPIAVHNVPLSVDTGNNSGFAPGVSVTDHGGGVLEFNVNETVALPPSRLGNQHHVDFELMAFAVAGDTNETNSANFSSTGTYTLGSTNPAIQFAQVPEPGTLSFLVVAGFFWIRSRFRVV